MFGGFHPVWFDYLVRRRRWLRGWLFVLLVGAVAAVWLMVTRRVDWPREVIVRLVLMGVVVLNALWWVQADLRLCESVGRPRRRRWLRGGLAAYMVLLIVPVLGVFLDRLNWTDLPLLAAVWGQIWHMALLVIVPVGAILGGIAWSVYVVRWAVMRDSARKESVPDGGRRALLQQAAVAAPLMLIGGASVAGKWQVKQFERNRYVISPPGLPERLRGLTITHLSDLHVGRLFREGQLARVIDAADAFDSDLVVMTGDLVDASLDYLPEAISALQGIRNRYGLYGCLGNHDLIEDGAAFAGYVREAGVGLLVNERRVIEIGGESLAIGGLDWARHGGGGDVMSEYEAYADATFGRSWELAGAERGQMASGDGASSVRWTDSGQAARPFTVALVHHPHAFDVLAARGVALTLSGHTHGGQFMLTPPGLPEVGAGNLLFRYIRGFYEAGDPGPGRCPMREGAVLESPWPLLYVNSGAGNWFPIRMNAPAEIVQLQLV